MENQLEKNMENVMETREYIGVITLDPEEMTRSRPALPSQEFPAGAIPPQGYSPP